MSEMSGPRGRSLKLREVLRGNRCIYATPALCLSYAAHRVHRVPLRHRPLLCVGGRGFLLGAYPRGQGVGLSAGVGSHDCLNFGEILANLTRYNIKPSPPLHIRGKTDISGTPGGGQNGHSGHPRGIRTSVRNRRLFRTPERNVSNKRSKSISNKRTSCIPMHPHAWSYIDAHRYVPLPYRRLSISPSVHVPLRTAMTSPT